MIFFVLKFAFLIFLKTIWVSISIKKMSFANKVVLITGASSGIGADAAIEFAKQGAKVALLGRNESRLNDVVNQIKSNGSPTPLAIVADVSKDATKIINKTIQHFGQLDVLVNNAAYGIFDSPSTVDLEKFDNLFATNVRSVVEITKLAVPHLESTKGNVINISSVAGLRAHGAAVSYCTSKATLDMYTKCAALELAPKGIRVNSINPGMIRTSFLQPMGLDDVAAQQFVESEVHKYPIGRIGEVADTSNAILFLASDKSSFINGASLVVDGGYQHF